MGRKDVKKKEERGKFKKMRKEQIFKGIESKGR
jgi:hypothetical protein